MTKVVSEAVKGLRGKICLYRGSMEKNNDASAMLGYGLKMARIPRRLVMTRSGCFLFGSISRCEYPSD